MAELHILRAHTVGLAAARKIALRWVEQAENEFGMACTYEEGTAMDKVGFERYGVAGTLTVTNDCFELHARLGFLLGAFKEKIEAQISRNLDTLLSAGP